MSRTAVVTTNGDTGETNALVTCIYACCLDSLPSSFSNWLACVAQIDASRTSLGVLKKACRVCFRLQFNQGDSYRRIIIDVQCPRRGNVETAVKTNLTAVGTALQCP